MKYDPHKYQSFTTEFILSHPIAAILLEMGLGKTVIVLTALMILLYEQFEVMKVLIIAPLRVAQSTWPAEIEKWEHLRGLRYSVVTGTAAERRKALSAKADVYIINRENLAWLVEESGVAFDFDMVVIDELSSFKNWQSKRVKALMRVRPKVKRIIGLTGTPGSLMDLFAEYKVLDQGERLGKYISTYRMDYFLPDQVCGPRVFSYKLRPGADRWIYDRISDITVSMKCITHLSMPELVSREYKVYLDDKEKELYKSMKQDLILQLPDGEVTASNAAALSGKLLQLANGAIYSDDGGVTEVHQKKLDALEDLIEAADAGKGGSGSLLVAYWFKHDLARIIERLKKLGVDYRVMDSDESFTVWNNGKVRVGLLHPASTGMGVNLQQGGNKLVWFGMIWSLELYQQTIARLWRQGQKSGIVIVEHIVTDATIDLRVMKALEQKDQTQSALIDAVRAEL